MGGRRGGVPFSLGPHGGSTSADRCEWDALHLAAYTYTAVSSLGI